MMYKITKSNFGDFIKYDLYHAEKGNGFSIVPVYGANVLQVHFNNIPVLDGYDTPEALAENKWSKNVILAPFPNRLLDGKYTHLDNEYQFDINNAATGNAIHGYLKTQPFEVVALRALKESALIICRFSESGQHSAYPFAFQFDVVFKISNDKGFEIKMTFKNLHHHAIPVGLGWHPYFKLNEEAKELSLQTPHLEKIHIDDRMIPNGEKTNYDEFIALKTIGDTILDNCFFIREQTNDIAQIILANDTHQLYYWQETGFQKWNFVQLFTPPHGKSVAIEPMTCNVDAFNNGDGLILLETNQIISASFGFILK